MNRICAKCRKDMGGVGGFTRARDTTAFLRLERKDIPEYCERCVAEETGQPLDLGERGDKQQAGGKGGRVGLATQRSEDASASPAALPEQEETRWKCTTCGTIQHGTGNICGNCNEVRT